MSGHRCISTGDIIPPLHEYIEGTEKIVCIHVCGVKDIQ